MTIIRAFLLFKMILLIISFNEAYAISWTNTETNPRSSTSHFTISLPSDWEIANVDEPNITSRGVVDNDTTHLQRILMATIVITPNANDIYFPDFSRLSIKELNEMAKIIILNYRTLLNTNNYEIYLEFLIFFPPKFF